MKFLTITYESNNHRPFSEFEKTCFSDYLLNTEGLGIVIGTFQIHLILNLPKNEIEEKTRKIKTIKEKVIKPNTFKEKEK